MKLSLAIMATLAIVSIVYWVVMFCVLYAMQSDAVWIPVLGWLALLTASLKFVVKRVA